MTTMNPFHFQRVLISSGVIDRLREAGIRRRYVSIYDGNLTLSTDGKPGWPCG
ncbi:MAG: hypothetical protein ACLUFA_08890 [[Clostridium] leptum]